MDYRYFRMFSHRPELDIHYHVSSTVQCREILGADFLAGNSPVCQQYISRGTHEVMNVICQHFSLERIERRHTSGRLGCFLSKSRHLRIWLVSKSRDSTSCLHISAIVLREGWLFVSSRVFTVGTSCPAMLGRIFRCSPSSPC